MPPLDAATEARIDRIWQERSARYTLFNGRVFCADTVTPTEILGHWTEYRRMTAQVADPGLFPILRQRSLAVCGVLLGPDGVVAGQRETNSSYLAGQWQLAPAGSVDQGASIPGGADWRQAILAELREELGIQPGEITAMRPLCLVQHPSGVLDLAIQLETALPAPAILERHASLGDHEYDQLLVAPPARLHAEITRRGGKLLPFALEILALLPP